MFSYYGREYEPMDGARVHDLILDDFLRKGVEKHAENFRAEMEIVMTAQKKEFNETVKAMRNKTNIIIKRLETIEAIIKKQEKIDDDEKEMERVRKQVEKKLKRKIKK